MDIAALPQDFNQGLQIILDNLPLIMDISARLVSAILVLVVGWAAGNWAQRRITASRRLDATLTSFFGGLLKYGIMAVSLITVLGQFGVQTASLLAVLGAAGLAIGLAMQGTLSNVAAGAMILILRPFNVGDYIQAAGIAGTVRALGLFGTEMTTPDNIHIFVPNGKIWGSDIWNYSRATHRRQTIRVGIGYGDDINKAFEIIRGVVEADARVMRGQPGRDPEIIVDKLADYAVDIVINFWSARTDMGGLKPGLTKQIKEALDAGGVSIPYPTRTLEMREIQTASTQ